MLTILISILGISGLAGLGWLVIRYAKQKETETKYDTYSENTKDAQERAERVAEIGFSNDITDRAELANRLRGQGRD